MQEEHGAELTPPNSLNLDVVVDIAVESWRFARLFARVTHKIDVIDQKRYNDQLRFYLTSLEKNLASVGLRLINLEGQSFDPGMAVTVANPGDFEPDEALFVEQMLEPVIMGDDGVVRAGKVILGKGQQCGTTSV